MAGAVLDEVDEGAGGLEVGALGAADAAAEVAPVVVPPDVEGKSEAARDEGVFGRCADAAATAVGILIGSFSFMKSLVLGGGGTKGACTVEGSLCGFPFVARVGVCLGVSSTFGRTELAACADADGAVGAGAVPFASSDVAASTGPSSSPCRAFPPLLLSRFPHRQLTSHRLARRLSFSFSSASTRFLSRL